MLEIIVLIIVLAATLAWVGRGIWRTVRGQAGCASCPSSESGIQGKALVGGCGQCQLQSACNKKQCGTAHPAAR